MSEILSSVLSAAINLTMCFAIAIRHNNIIQTSLPNIKRCPIESISVESFDSIANINFLVT